MPTTDTTSPSSDELKHTILNNILIHDENCSSSLYGYHCDCIQLSVVTNIMGAITTHHQAEIERAVAEAFQKGQRVGQYQAADRLYGHVTSMYIFKDGKNPKLFDMKSNDLLIDCEKYMNHNSKIYSQYVNELIEADRKKRLTPPTNEKENDV